MFGHLEQINYAAWADKEYKKRESAVEKGLSECTRCGACCARRTCTPLPNEIPRIAEFLKLSVEDFVSRYMIGDSNNEAGYHLKFANDKQLDIVGTYISSSRTFDMGMCLMYDEKEKVCKIHAVKPYEAVESNCWVEPDNATFAHESWKDGDMEKFGVKPY